MGVISGDMLIDGHPRDDSFQRKTGYVQQQDLHLETSTVREALAFSALLRQPKTTPKAEKMGYVEEVIKLLEMEEYAEAVIGVPGEGLNVEQRKRLTIGVELAAKPDLLLFFDEPTRSVVYPAWRAVDFWCIILYLADWTHKPLGPSAAWCENSQTTARLFFVRSINRRPSSCKSSTDYYSWHLAVERSTSVTSARTAPPLPGTSSRTVRLLVHLRQTPPNGC